MNRHHLRCQRESDRHHVLFTAALPLVVPPSADVAHGVQLPTQAVSFELNPLLYQRVSTRQGPLLSSFNFTVYSFTSGVAGSGNASLSRAGHFQSAAIPGREAERRRGVLAVSRKLTSVNGDEWGRQRRRKQQLVRFYLQHATRCSASG